MPVRIKKIEISNFRSIQKIIIECARLQVIVGNNDAGKSNILRALNLFFNNETNPGEKFDFKTDYNIYAANRNTKKAKETKIKLTLEIPSSYHATNGDLIEWTKSWRAGGFYYEDMVGFISSSGPRGGSKIERKEIPARSNIKQLLSNIKYVYVPAIKDKKYISKLRSEIYFVVNDVFNENFNDSSKAFERSIAENLQELTKDISHALGFNSELSLPRDLSNLFGSLDFLSEMQISLNERGDGIKARHIPIILKFIAEKTKTLQARGNPPYTFIWGYEEPENNLELTSAIKLASQFQSFVPEPISQLLITTHSPAFYNLSKKDDAIKCVFIEKDTNDQTSCDHQQDLIDDRMGVMELLSPYIEEIKERIDNLESIQEISNRKAIIYVEGTSDKIIIEKAINIFTPIMSDRVEIITKDYGAGCNYVLDMLKAYFHMHKHHKEKFKCVGIVDSDDDGKKVKQELSQIQDIGKSVKCYLLPLAEDVVRARKDGFTIPGVLECNYPISIWSKELNKDNLEERKNMREVLSDSLISTLTQSDKTLAQCLDDKDYKIKVTHTIPKDRKIPLAQKISKMDNTCAALHLEFLRSMMLDIERFLFNNKANTTAG
ncbi:ATP-dependent endonuclease [Aeromonas veronii]|uniref:ATP-dependent nuclease n=1 Tax=Aeromonas veronii TaxID=654 RepID=UPI0030067857